MKNEETKAQVLEILASFGHAALCQESWDGLFEFKTDSIPFQLKCLADPSRRPAGSIDLDSKTVNMFWSCPEGHFSVFVETTVEKLPGLIRWVEAQKPSAIRYAQAWTKAGFDVFGSSGPIL